jgi:MFS family permease
MNLAMDIYTPSLPAIAHSLHAEINLTQFSVAVFVGGVAIARLLFSIFSDAFGRKMFVIFGAILAVSGSILCLYASNIYVLITGRFLQGLGAGGVNILGRIILRDISDGPRLSQFMSYFSMNGVGLSIIAPLFGGYLQHFFNWRSIFLEEI